MLLTVVPTAALDVTRALFQEVQEKLVCEHISILIQDPNVVSKEKMVLWSHHSSGWFSHLRSHPVPEGVGLSWLTLRAKTTQIFKNPASHPAVFETEPQHAPIQIQVSVPMLGKEQPLGVLHVMRSPSQPLGQNELHWLEQRVQASVVALEQAFALERQLQNQIPSTSQAVQLSRFVTAFALYLGEPRPIANAIAMAAKLLTTETPTQNLCLPLETREALAHRHTHYDGTGTPSIQGKNIAYSARIIQVVITYLDSIQHGLSPAESMAALKHQAGWKLDPLLVGAFEQHMRS